MKTLPRSLQKVSDKLKDTRGKTSCEVYLDFSNHCTCLLCKIPSHVPFKERKMQRDCWEKLLETHKHWCSGVPPPSFGGVLHMLALPWDSVRNVATCLRARPAGTRWPGAAPAAAVPDRGTAGRALSGISPAVSVAPPRPRRCTVLKFKLPLVNTATSMSFSLKGGWSYIPGFWIAFVLHWEEIVPACCTRGQVLSFAI